MEKHFFLLNAIHATTPLLASWPRCMMSDIDMIIATLQEQGEMLAQLTTHLLNQKMTTHARGNDKHQTRKGQAPWRHYTGK